MMEKNSSKLQILRKFYRTRIETFKLCNDDDDDTRMCRLGSVANV